MAYFQLNSGLLTQYGRGATPSVMSDPVGSMVSGFQTGQNISLKYSANKRAEEEIAMKKQKIIDDAAIREEAKRRDERDAKLAQDKEDRLSAAADRAAENDKYLKTQRGAQEAAREASRKASEASAAAASVRAQASQLTIDERKKANKSENLGAEILQESSALPKIERADYITKRMVEGAGELSLEETKTLIEARGEPVGAKAIAERKAQNISMGVMEIVSKNVRGGAEYLAEAYGFSPDDMIDAKMVKGENTEDPMDDEIKFILKDKVNQGESITRTIKMGDVIPKLGQEGTNIMNYYSNKDRQNTQRQLVEDRNRMKVNILEIKNKIAQDVRFSDIQLKDMPDGAQAAAGVALNKIAPDLVDYLVQQDKDKGDGSNINEYVMYADIAKAAAIQVDQLHIPMQTALEDAAINMAAYMRTNDEELKKTIMGRLFGKLEVTTDGTLPLRTGGDAAKEFEGALDGTKQSSRYGRSANARPTRVVKNKKTGETKKQVKINGEWVDK